MAKFQIWPFLAVFENVFFTLKFSKNGQFYRPPKNRPIFEVSKNSTTEAGGFPSQTLLKFLGPKIGPFWGLKI